MRQETYTVKLGHSHLARSLQRIDDIEGGNSFALRMFGVRYRVANDILKEDLRAG